MFLNGLLPDSDEIWMSSTLDLVWLRTPIIISRVASRGCRFSVGWPGLSGYQGNGSRRWRWSRSGDRGLRWIRRWTICLWGTAHHSYVVGKISYMLSLAVTSCHLQLQAVTYCQLQWQALTCADRHWNVASVTPQEWTDWPIHSPLPQHFSTEPLG